MKSVKRVALAGMALIATLVLVACGSGSSKSGANGKVSLSINYYNGAISKGSIANAKKEFADYDLQFKQIPANEDFDTKLKASLGSKSAPDITAINSNIQDYIPYKEKFVNLTKYGTNKLAKEYVNWKWDSTFATKDYQIAMPIDIGPTALMYSVANFKKAGLPTDPDVVSKMLATDEDYMNAAKQLKEKANKPMFLSAVSLFQVYSRKLSKDLYKNGKLTLADGEFKEAWNFAVRAYKSGYTLGIKANSADNVNAQTKNLYSSMVEASWGIADLDENGTKPDTWLIAKAPGKPSNYGGSYLAVLKTTDHPKEAAKVVTYLTNEKNQRVNYKELSLFPSYKAVYDDKFLNVTHRLFGDEKYNKYFVESANTLKYVKADPRSSTVQRIFEDQLTLVSDQGKDPDTAWKDAVKKAQTVD